MNKFNAYDKFADIWTFEILKTNNYYLRTVCTNNPYD